MKRKSDHIALSTRLEQLQDQNQHLTQELEQNRNERGLLKEDLIRAESTVDQLTKKLADQKRDLEEIQKKFSS